MLALKLSPGNKNECFLKNTQEAEGRNSKPPESMSATFNTTPTDQKVNIMAANIKPANQSSNKNYAKWQ